MRDETKLISMGVFVHVRAVLYSQVTLHGSSESDSGVDFYRPVLDENGSPRRLAVKRMPWDIINRTLGTVREVSYTIMSQTKARCVSQRPCSVRQRYIERPFSSKLA